MDSVSPNLCVRQSKGENACDKVDGAHDENADFLYSDAHIFESFAIRASIFYSLKASYSDYPSPLPDRYIFCHFLISLPGTCSREEEVATLRHVNDQSYRFN